MQKPITYSLLIISAVVYFLIGYEVDRSDFFRLFSLFTFLFLTYAYFALPTKRTDTFSPGRLNLLIGFAIGFRVIMLFFIPNLSDDYARFIWDGRLLTNGLNSFDHLPSYYINNSILSESLNIKLYGLLNSSNYFTIYPPICQGIFYIASLLFPKSLLGAVITIKLFILFSEIGTLYFLLKLLPLFKLSKYNVLLYALNPLVIIELTGNIHFEGLMIFFLVLTVYLLKTNRLYLSAGPLALAVCSKLIPLMLIPLLFRKLGFKKLLFYASSVILISAACFFPFINHNLITNISSSIGLYFQKFEFNASIYYLVREIGYQVKGYNIIATAGSVLSLFILFAILTMSLINKKTTTKNWVKFSLFALTLYFLLATIIHPWYITTLVALCTLTNFRYPIVWSFLVFLSYSFYQNEAFQENYWLLTVEYGTLVIFILAETFLYKKKNIQ